MRGAPYLKFSSKLIFIFALVLLSSAYFIPAKNAKADTCVPNCTHNIWLPVLPDGYLDLLCPDETIHQTGTCGRTQDVQGTKRGCTGRWRNTCVDQDNDGYDNCSPGTRGDDGKTIDCNDNDASINPGATEVCGDGIDQDCSGADLPCGGTPPPVVAAFDVQPRTTTASVAATFDVTYDIVFQRVELWRAGYNSTNCNETNKTGCSWSQIQTKNFSQITYINFFGFDINVANAMCSGCIKSGSFPDSPAVGVYLYGLHAVDAAGNISFEPSPIKVTITAPPPPPTCTDNDGDGYGAVGSTGCTYPGVDCNDSNPSFHPGATEVCGNGLDEQICLPINDPCPPPCNYQNWLALPACGSSFNQGAAVTVKTTIQFNIDFSPTVVQAQIYAPNNTTHLTDVNLTKNADNTWEGNLPGNLTLSYPPGTYHINLRSDFQITMSARDFMITSSTCTDNDGDGYGTAGSTNCPKPGVDCDDTKNYVHPGATETCDGADNNCNGVTDEGCDKDGDGYCDSSRQIYNNTGMCPNTTFLSNGMYGDDCDDTNASKHPGGVSCSITYCGDGIVQTSPPNDDGVSEQCEPPNTATCDSNCQNQ